MRRRAEGFHRRGVWMGLSAQEIFNLLKERNSLKHGTKGILRRFDFALNYSGFFHDWPSSVSWLAWYWCCQGDGEEQAALPSLEERRYLGIIGVAGLQAGRPLKMLALWRCLKSQLLIVFHCQVRIYYPLERKDATLETALFWLALPSTKGSRCLAAHLPDCWGVLSKPLKIGWSKSWLNRCQKKLEIKFQTPWHQLPQEILLNKITQCILDSKVL